MCILFGVCVCVGRSFSRVGGLNVCVCVFFLCISELKDFGCFCDR